MLLNLLSVIVNSVAKTISATLTFSYQGLTISKTINDFTYKEEYELSIKPSATNKMANEVLKTDIDTSHLPNGVTITSVIPSTIKQDGSTIKLTFRSGDVREQELGGFVTYEQKAQELLQNATSSDFSVSNKKDILPSTYIDKQTFLNQLKAKASLLSGLAKTKVENILKIASISFNPNDQTKTLSFQIVIGNIKKSFTITGLEGINTINQKIDAEVARKTMPTIKNGSNWKSASQVETTDIAITSSDDGLMARVINVSEKTSLSRNLTESIVLVTIEVSSSVVGTKTSRYDVELGGFVSESYTRNMGKVLNFRNRISIQWNIENKANILPSEFHNINLIKNILKSKIDSLINSRERSFRNVVLFKNVIDNNLKVIFNPNDETGILVFDLKFGYNVKTYTINGFKTSSS